MGLVNHLLLIALLIVGSLLLFFLILDLYLRIVVLFAPLLVYLRRAPCLLLIRTAILSKFNLILLVVIDGGQQGLSTRIGNVAVSRNAIATLVQIQCLVVRVFRMTIEALVDGIELLSGHVVSGHRSIPRVLRRLLVYCVLISFLVVAIFVNVVYLVLYIIFVFRHF